jgi:outer membrane protein
MLRNAAALAMIITLGGAVALAQQPSKSLSLAECIRIAEERHPDLAAAHDEVRAAEARLRGAHAAYLPRVDFGASYIRQTYNYAGTPGTQPRVFKLFYNGESSATAPYYFGGLTLTQMVYDFGHTKGTVQRSESELQASRRNLERERQLIDLGVRTAYYQVLAAKELVRIRQDAVDNQCKHLEQVQAFFQVGTRPKIDVTRQEVALANARVDLRQAQEDLEVAKAALATAMGLPIEQAPEPSGTLSEEQVIPSLPQLLAQAEQNRPDVAAQRAQLDAARADIIVAHSNFRPNLSLNGFFNYRNLKLPLVYNWSIGQVVAQNLFAGGADRALMAQTQAQADAAQHQLDSLIQQVRQQVFTAYSDLNVAKDRIALAIKTEEEAKENLELAEGRYQAGYGNIIELTDAQLLETESQAAAITARYAYQTAAARLDAAVGR